ncbi:hypothetical protein J2T02_000301 [Chitinophaga terrae (ex Kim and Jung 2007)]|nr:hypothetical protein [Chitinophaga terrae (ex Kim and Jung 2007)]
MNVTLTQKFIAELFGPLYWFLWAAAARFWPGRM